MINEERMHLAELFIECGSDSKKTYTAVRDWIDGRDGDLRHRLAEQVEKITTQTNLTDLAKKIREHRESEFVS